ncbi:hypothetical protein Y025_5195 [Burkholderia pseudomallei TSV32]|nr:hypothetical protein Y025_5195 [Burkholderia pseudomallei TSV32]
MTHSHAQGPSLSRENLNMVSSFSRCWSDAAIHLIQIKRLG